MTNIKIETCHDHFSFLYVAMISQMGKKEACSSKLCFTSFFFPKFLTMEILLLTVCCKIWFCWLVTMSYSRLHAQNIGGHHEICTSLHAVCMVRIKGTSIEVQQNNLKCMHHLSTMADV